MAGLQGAYPRPGPQLGQAEHAAPRHVGIILRHHHDDKLRVVGTCEVGEVRELVHDATHECHRVTLTAGGRDGGRLRDGGEGRDVPCANQVRHKTSVITIQRTDE